MKNLSDDALRMEGLQQKSAADGLPAEMVIADDLMHLVRSESGNSQ
jgi:hypothetical protein